MADRNQQTTQPLAVKDTYLPFVERNTELERQAVDKMHTMGQGKRSVIEYLARFDRMYYSRGERPNVSRLLDDISNAHRGLNQEIKNVLVMAMFYYYIEMNRRFNCYS